MRALADGSAWIAIENLGTDFRVKAAGGPTVKIATPKEGVFGFIDGEQIVKASAHKNRFNQFMNAMAQPNWIAQNFLANGRPLFNEKAYKYLVDHGLQGAGGPPVLQPSRERAEDDAQGTVRERAGVHRRVQPVFGA